jgi:hypothetical protein
VKTNGNGTGNKSDKRNVEAHHYDSGMSSRKKNKSDKQRSCRNSSDDESVTSMHYTEIKDKDDTVACWTSSIFDE